MVTIGKNDLQFKYSWTAIAPDDPRITGTPDSTFLNRAEAYEVLAFLNRVCTKTREQARKAERMIQQHLPGTIRSHANVLAWLQANWLAHA